MREIKLGNRKIIIHGSPITPYHYKKAFNQSFSGDLAAMSLMGNDYSKLDDINLLQMIWAMEKTHSNTIKQFEAWLMDFENMDITAVIVDAVEEGMDATFHTGEAEPTE